MNGVLLFANIYLVLVLALSIFLKRRYEVRYDRKTIFSAFLFLLVALILWKWGDMQSSIFNNQIDPSSIQKWTKLLILVFASNAIIQFIFWSIFTIIRKNDLVKMPRFIFNIFALLVIVGISLYSYKLIFNANLSHLLVTSTVLSAVIGLSLQDTLTNLFAGLSLQVESPFNVDDWVNLGGYEGKVVSQNWRSLTLLTRENHRIFLPNKAVAEEKIVNFSRPTLRQIHSFYVDLDYAHPPNFVKNTISALLDEIDEVSIDSTAYPFVVSYEASGIRYCIKYWIEDYANVIAIQDVVLTRLWYTLDRNKIKIPYTISEIHMELESPESDKRKKEEKSNYIKEKLSEQDWLSELDESQLDLLSESARLERYAANDNLVTQGEEGDSMFFVVSGSTKVLVKGAYNTDVYVADKKVGDFFGEMSLLTGDPRTATVRASEDTEVIVIDKASFTKILAKDSKILGSLFDALESHQSSLTKIIEEAKNSSNIPIQSARKIIMNKIFGYLNLK